jgi:hypothetical protein
MSQTSDRVPVEEIQEAFQHLKRSLKRRETAATLGNEGAKISVQLYSPIRTRFSISAAAGRRARVDQINAEIDRIMQEEREDTIQSTYGSPDKKRKASVPTIQESNKNLLTLVSRPPVSPKFHSCFPSLASMVEPTTVGSSSSLGSDQNEGFLTTTSNREHSLDIRHSH